ncbi:DUF5690 family protein [Larkinella punicea]|uniref:MFS transporter n=1 Tax=Larkinella punicea TaxID=2315727 RepID=A0A368JUV6_9BACT|nr:DUF5690 family protein [Larkinella punicea]RCR71438.1 hypothetical protein DUE52_00425 [Larkinella punicea]
MLNKSILRNPIFFIAFGAVAAFCTYACMYAFRKGITAVIFEGMSYAGISYKIWLITAQVLGYAVSKRIGVKVVSEMRPAQRALYILVFIGLAELALLGFALTPPPYNIVFLFLNGLPLGMVYGIMLGFLEGRRQTDALVAGLTASFIFASGFVKTVALTIRSAWGISEFWLPFVTGLLFVVPLLISVWMMTLLPAPTPEDRDLRTERRPMNQTERRHFLQTFSVGLTTLIVSYVLLSAFRDFRDNFAPEILSAVGITNPGVFTKTETTVAFGILVVMGALQLIKDNFLAFRLINIVMLLSAVLIGVSTWFFQQGILSPGTWFTLVGLGLYGAYVPCNGLYFERLVASFRYVSTVGFIVTLADYYGYMGSVAVVLYKNFGQPNISFLDFFIYSAYVISVVYGVLIVVSFGYFQRKYKAVVSQRLEESVSRS